MVLSLKWLVSKESACNAGDTWDAGSILGQEYPLEEELAAHCSILDWRIPWREEPGRLQSTRLQSLDTTEWLSKQELT